MVVVVVVVLYCILAHCIRVWSTYAINAYRIQSDRDPDPLAEGDRAGCECEQVASGAAMEAGRGARHEALFIPAVEGTAHAGGVAGGCCQGPV